MVSQDGGVPLRRKRWHGHTSATQVLQERAQALMTTLQHAPRPRSLGADATLSHAAQAAHLPSLGCITRIPHTLKVVGQVIRQALAMDLWQRLEAPTRSQRLE